MKIILDIKKNDKKSPVWFAIWQTYNFQRMYDMTMNFSLET